jgi:hypothetical protein
MRRFLKSLLGTAAVALSVPIGAASAGQIGPDLGAIFGARCRCLQVVDQFGTVSRTAFDASGGRIGTQVGTYDPDEPNKMRVEMTYLVPDAEHPFGQTFDGAGNRTPLHL